MAERQSGQNGYMVRLDWLSINQGTAEMTWYCCTYMHWKGAFRVACAGTRVLACTATFLSGCDPVQSLLSWWRQTELSFCVRLARHLAVYQSLSLTLFCVLSIPRITFAAAGWRKNAFPPPTISLYGVGLTIIALASHSLHWNLGDEPLPSIYGEKHVISYSHKCGQIFYVILAGGCWNIKKHVHVYRKVGKCHFLSLSCHPKCYSRLANALWIIRGIHWRRTDYRNEWCMWACSIVWA